VFIFIGFTFEYIFEKINFLTGTKSSAWLHVALLITLLAPGIVGIVQLHPYEYSYYNSFIGGTNGAFRRYETEYWLTCYKEAVEQLNQKISADRQTRSVCRRNLCKR
jgi:hypothetical protein